MILNPAWDFKIFTLEKVLKLIFGGKYCKKKILNSKQVDYFNYNVL